MTSRRFNAKEELEKLHVEVPKALLYEEAYKATDNRKALSNESKLLYAILQDRTLLSIHNSNKDKDADESKSRFIDENGDIFIYFDNISIAEILNISEKKVRVLKKELIAFDLLEDVRQGIGKANRLYLNKPVSTVDNLKLYTNTFKSVVGIKKEIERKRIEQYRVNKAQAIENTLNGKFDRTSTDEFTVPVQSNLPSSNNYKSKTKESKTDFKDFKSVVVVYTNAHEIQKDSSLTKNRKLIELTKLIYMNDYTKALVSEFIENDILLSDKQINMLSKLDYKVAVSSLELTVAQGGKTFSYFYKVYKTEEQKDIDTFVEDFYIDPKDTFTSGEDFNNIDTPSLEEREEEEDKTTNENINVQKVCYEDAVKKNWEIAEFTYKIAKKYAQNNNLFCPTITEFI